MAVGTSQPTVKMLKLSWIIIDYQMLWIGDCHWPFYLSHLCIHPFFLESKKHLIDMIHTVYIYIIYILICYRPILGLRGAHYLDLVKVKILRLV